MDTGQLAHCMWPGKELLGINYTRSAILELLASIGCPINLPGKNSSLYGYRILSVCV